MRSGFWVSKHVFGRYDSFADFSGLVNFCLETTNKAGRAGDQPRLVTQRTHAHCRSSDESSGVRTRSITAVVVRVAISSIMMATVRAALVVAAMSGARTFFDLFVALGW